MMIIIIPRNKSIDEILYVLPGDGIRRVEVLEAVVWNILMQFDLEDAMTVTYNIC